MRDRGNGFWRRLWAIRRASEPRNPEGPVPFYAAPSAGVRVTSTNILQNPSVWACHRYLTQTVAQLPVRIMRDQGTTSTRLTRHPVYALFAWEPNPEISAFQFKETLTGWALTHGNGVAEIERDDQGRVVALWPIHPDRVQFLRDASIGDLIYRISNGVDGVTDLARRDVFHIRGFGNGPVGLSICDYANETLGWAKATELFGASFFGNGLNVSGVIEGAGGLDDAGQKRLTTQLAQRHGGPRRSHLPLFLDKAMKWVPTSAKPDEAQFLETMQFQVETVCRLFGVPPHKVQHLLRSTF